MKIIDFIKNNNEYLEDFITRSTYNSNGIEGSTLTYSETYAILYNDNSFKINDIEPREIYEALNHKKALNYCLDNIEDELREQFIKKINEIINQGIKDTTGYRNISVMIRASDHIPPEPEKINSLMMYYVYNYNNSTDNIFSKIAYNHIEFECIHPFEDGNGRTGRILINYELIKNNIAPIVILKEDRVKYFEFLRNKDTDGLAKFIEELSNKELNRMKTLGFIDTL